MKPYKCHKHGFIEPRITTPRFVKKRNKMVSDRMCPICYKEWADKGHEKQKLKRAELYKSDPELYKRLNRSWLKNDPERMKLYSQKSRAKKQGVKIIDFTYYQWIELIEEYKHCCAYCEKHFMDLTIDHVIPLSKGGNHTKSNIVPACFKCNVEKGTKILE